MRSSLRLFFIFCAGLVPFAALSAETPPVKETEKYEYRPVNRSYWAKIDSAVESGSVADIFKIAMPKGKSDAARDEWKLGTARGLIKNGNFIHAQYLLTGVAAKSIGTQQGLQALRLIDQIAREAIVDESYLEELAFDLDAKIDEPEAKSLVGYFRARFLMRKGYAEWSQSSLQDIRPETTWSTEVKYDRTQQLVNAGDSAGAYASFETLVSDPSTRKQTIQMARLALARLVFERRDYKAAIATYSTIDLPTRERARSLNELAWAYYYDHAYGRALGAIRALKSAYFAPLLSPESLVLEMLIYRELCHYGRVKEIAQEFNRTYQPVFSAIEQRKRMDLVPEFIQMALQEGILQRRARGIQQLRLERRSLDRSQTAAQWAESEALVDILKFGEKRERITDAEITRMMKPRADRLANWFVDLREQVSFLEYEASMRMIGMSDNRARVYEPPKANLSKPETLFWPLTDESWYDELLDYELLVKDACAGGRK